MKKYQIIYADPPWSYGKTLDYKGTHGQVNNTLHYYNEMTTKDIKRLEIPSDTDSWLILWGTATKLPEAIDTLKSWGFEYRTCAIWDKWHLGLGWFFRLQHELILIGKKGNPKKPLVRVRSVFNEKRTTHSKKPLCVRKWINEAFPEQSKLELFARQKTKGWDVWGNEVESDITLGGLNDLQTSN